MERRESDREEGWGIRRTIYLGGGGLGTMVSVLLQPLWAQHGGRKLSCCGWMPLWPDPFCVPPSSHGSLSVAGALMAFTHLIGAHRILVGIVLTCKKDKGETLTHSRGSYFGRSEQWGFWNTPEGNPHQRNSVATKQLPVGRGSLWERRSEEGGQETPSPWTRHQKYHGLGAGWKRISRHETIQGWFFSFCILRPSLVLSALHTLGNHNLGRKKHFIYLVYTLYLSDCFYQSLESAREITKNQ